MVLASVLPTDEIESLEPDRPCRHVPILGQAPSAKITFDRAHFIRIALGPRETSLRQSLIMSRADLTVFFRRPLSATLLVIAVALVVVPVIRQLTARRGMA